jgi:hypothetical protein
MVIAPTLSLQIRDSRSSLSSQIRTDALVPSGPAPVDNCFGGTPCAGTSDGSTAGKGTTCSVAITETAGDFLYFALNYGSGSNLGSALGDGGADSFNYLGGEFSDGDSVAFWDVPSDHGGSVVISATLTEAEYGTCWAGQLSPGTVAGSVGTGGATQSGSSLTVSVSPYYQPSLLMVLFGAQRPTGSSSISSPAGTTLLGTQDTGYVPGTGDLLGSYVDSGSAGTAVSFTMQAGYSDVAMSGIAVEFDQSAVYGAPYPQVTWGDDSSGGGNIFDYGPDIYTDGYAYDYQQSGATNGVSSLTTAMSFYGNKITFSQAVTANFYFYTGNAWSWWVDSTCQYGGDIEFQAAGYWIVGLVGFPQLNLEGQMFAEEGGGLCLFEGHNGMSPAQSGSGQGPVAISLTASLPAGTYQPSADFYVYTYASASADASITAYVNMGQPPATYDGFWDEVIVTT